MGRDDVVTEYRIVMTRHGTRPLRYGGRAYPRLGAASLEQAKRFVAEEEKDGFRSWIESREVTPWRKVNP